MLPSSRMSTKTGRAPVARIMLPVAWNVNGVVITSSPGPMPCASSATCSAAVPFATATASRVSETSRANVSSKLPRHRPRRKLARVEHRQHGRALLVADCGCGDADQRQRLVQRRQVVALAAVRAASSRLALAAQRLAAAAGVADEARRAADDEAVVGHVARDGGARRRPSPSADRDAGEDHRAGADRRAVVDERRHSRPVLFGEKRRPA